MKRKPLLIWFPIIISLAIGAGTAACAAKDPFPQYEALVANVSFWKQIYSRYPTTRAVVHDSRNLNVIYDVIPIRHYTARGARKFNRARMKEAKARYRNILKRLAANPKTEHLVTAVITGTYSDTVINDSLAAGAVECIFGVIDPQAVVAQCLGRRADRGRLVGEHPLPSDAVEAAVAGDGRQPRARAVRDPGLGPTLQGEDERVLQRLFGPIEIPERGHESSRDRAVLSLEHAVDGLLELGVTHAASG